MKGKKKKSKIRTFLQLFILVFGVSLFTTPEHSNHLFLGILAILILIGTLSLRLYVSHGVNKYILSRFRSIFRKKNLQPEPDTETLLWRQINYQVTDRIHESFPEATWEFVKRPELNQLLNSEKIRIRTFRTKDYHFAEFHLDQYGHLQLEFLTLTSHKEKCDKQGFLPSEQIDPESWYSLIGKPALIELIGDLQARGYQKLFISETGEIFIQNGEALEPRGLLEKFPPRSHWSVLCDILIRDELDATEAENTLKLSWS